MSLIESIINKPKKLSEDQKNAVLCDAKHIRIIAGAGAGKTETLTRRIVYLLLVKKVEPSSIVAFTFTEKAAESMKNRVYERVKQLGGPEICNKLGEVFIGTIHAYCARLLEEYFGYGNYGVIDDKQEMAYVMNHGWGLNLGHNGNYSSNCENFLNALNVYYGELISEERVRTKSPNFFDKLKKYETLLKDNKRLTFNQMINLAVKHLEEKPEIANDVDYLIVDEYQDINRAQQKLIKLIGEDGSIFIVGDPRQTIYQWRGSDETCFEEFATTYADTVTIRISENRRSTESIIHLANNFSDTFEDKKYGHMIPMRAESGGCYLVNNESAQTEVEWIADTIQREVTAGRCAYGDIAILMRSVSTSGPPFIDEFRARQIPVVVGGKIGLFRRSEIQALGKIFAWVSPRGFWKPDRYKTDTTNGDDLIEEAQLDWNAALPEIPVTDKTLASLRLWKENVVSNSYDNFTDIFHELLIILHYHELNPDDSGHAVIMANMGQFSTLISDFETANMLGGCGQRNWNKEFKNLCWFMNTFATSKYEEQTGDDSFGSLDAVKLMTVHQSKGLEWALVFLPALVNRRFPSSMAGRSRDWMISPSLFDVGKYEGDENSERKLFYVALTRAKDVVICSTFSRVNVNNVGQSCFVDDLEEDGEIIHLPSSEPLPEHNYSISQTSDELQTFSAGEIVDYMKCPYMYRLRHLWGYQSLFSEYLGYGNSLHFCLRETARLMKEKGLPPRMAVATAVEDCFFMPFMTKDNVQKIKDATKKNLMRFVREFEADMLNIREVESRIEFPIQNAIVAGKVDVILHNKDGSKSVEVREYKSKEEVVTTEDVAMQVRLYARGLSVMGDEVTKGSVAYIHENSIESVGVTESEIDYTVTSVEECIEKINRGEFMGSSGNHCDTCDYRKICRWRR